MLKEHHCIVDVLIIPYHTIFSCVYLGLLVGLLNLTAGAKVV